MHERAFKNGVAFFNTYAPTLEKMSKTPFVIEIGAEEINGSLRQACPVRFQYVGADFRAGKGVDFVLDDPYQLPFGDNFADAIVCSTCFEHVEMFWLLFLEALRVLKPHGLFYLNTSSSGGFHRFPVDAWRFYPDSGSSLVAWARRHKIPAVLLESYVQKGGSWQDFVAVFLKEEAFVPQYPNRILAHKTDFENGKMFGKNGFINFSARSQNETKLSLIEEIAHGE